MSPMIALRCLLGEDGFKVKVLGNGKHRNVVSLAYQNYMIPQAAGQTLDLLLLLYSLDSLLSFDMHKAIVKNFIFGGHFGHSRSLEGHTLNLLLLLYSLGSQLSFDMHKAIVIFIFGGHLGH